MDSTTGQQVESDREQAIRHAFLQSRATMVLLAALVTCTALVFAYSLLATPSAPVDEQELIAVAKKRITERSNDIAEEITSLASEVLPPATKAFRRQLEQDLPLYAEALEEEGDELLAGLTDQVRQRLREQADEFLAEHRKVFREEFPEVADDEAVDRLVQSYEETANRLIERYYLDDFRRQAERTASLWKTIEPAPPPAEGTQEELLMQYVGDWLALQAKDAATEGLFTHDEAAANSPR